MTTTALAAQVGAACGSILILVHLLRPKRSVAHWSFVAGIAALTVEAIYIGLVAGSASQDELLLQEGRRLLALSFIPGTWLLFSLTYARGASFGKVRAGRWLVAGSFLVPVLVGILFRHNLVSLVEIGAPRPRMALALGAPALVLKGLLLITSIMVLMNLERTFRSAVGTMRWRIKFMLLGVGVLFVARIYTSSQALLFKNVNLQIDTVNSMALIVGSVLIALSLFRAGKFEVDVYPSQSVLQNSITVLLAGIYLVIVGILAKVASLVGGDSEFALKAFVTLVSLVFLAIFLQSDRVRLHLRRFVSRNFQRPIHDYRTVWRKFTEGTASRVEKPDLCRSLVRMVADVFQVLSVAIWLVDEGDGALVLAGSTFLPEEKGRVHALRQPVASDLVAHFRAHPEPVDFEVLGPDWAAGLRDIHPSQFPNGGNRVCVPLLSQGDVIGVMTLGDRVGGVEYSLQDFDMLQCVADHASADLRNVQLSQKLLQSKELEAFQTMAAFFVHDLKNAASTLNLMLQNLPEHFDDPEFREDSLRGVSKTVEHIKMLIGRLSLLRHEQELHTSELDLNEIVSGAIRGLEQGAGEKLTKDMNSVPLLLIDREQMSKVVTNLVLNATEAVSAQGRVRIGTRADSSWVVLEVEDNGCGMSADFVAKNLFRPFQTTKKSGLGIGMFQSKMIVEAHGGKLAVASEKGKGSTFQVFLPRAPRSP